MSTSNLPTVNLPLIQSRISEVHKAFMKAVGEMPSKLTADHKLLLTRMATRIHAILKCFVDAKIIDNITSNIDRLQSDESYRVFKLTKNGFDRTIYIWTDGVNVNVKTSDYPNSSGLDDDIRIPNVDIDTYNWIVFADELLDFIHNVIYQRIKSIETRIFKRSLK